MKNDENQFGINVRSEEFVEKSMYAIAIEDEEEDRLYIIIFFIIALLLLIFIVVGFSFSMFDGSVTGPVTPIVPTDSPVEPTHDPVEPTHDPVEPTHDPVVPTHDPVKPTDDPVEPTHDPVVPPSGNIVFNYSDVAYGGNGISLMNASAIPDAAGKKLIGTGNVFEFSVSGKFDANGKFKYYIVLEEEKASTLDDEDVKVYLTSRSGSTERELMTIVPIISSLKSKTINGVKYKVLFEKTIQSRDSFMDEYSLRMWIKEDAENYYGKKYSLKVNVFAEGVSD